MAQQELISQNRCHHKGGYGAVYSCRSSSFWFGHVKVRCKSHLSLTVRYNTKRVQYEFGVFLAASHKTKFLSFFYFFFVAFSSGSVHCIRSEVIVITLNCLVLV